jgi:effector-binding domain-containing protein
MNIVEKTLPERTYLTVKKTIPFTEVTNKQMYDEAGQKLGTYIAEHGVTVTGPWTVLYFTWDLTAKKTSLGIAFPVAEGTKVKDEELSIVHVPEVRVVSGVYEGSYEHIKDAHEALILYLGEEGYSLYQDGVMAFEEYIVGPKEEKNPEQWKTVISYVLV